MDVYLAVELLDYMVVIFLDFEEAPYYFPQWLHQFTFPLTVYKKLLFSTSSKTTKMAKKDATLTFSHKHTQTTTVCRITTDEKDENLSEKTFSNIKKEQQ